MNGIEFIDSAGAILASPEFDRISTAMVLPEPYVSDNPLAKHLWQAMWHPATELSVLDHVQNRTGKPFSCYSFYADDTDIVAVCTPHEEGYVAMVGIRFVRRLVKICALLGPALRNRPRSPSRGTTDANRLVSDAQLRGLIGGDEQVSEAEALEIVAGWPDYDAEALQIELGEFALFYDLLRLVWLHEWAHALCGHIAFAKSSLGLTQLYEFSADRPGSAQVAGVNFSRFEVLQSLEMHADEFATHYCVRELLFGYDPAGRIAGPNVDMVDRLLFFNIACCLFAIIWETAERKFLPDQSYYPPRPDLASNEPEPLFRLFESSHPPADLRYLRFRGFQRQHTDEWRGEGAGHLGISVDGVSLRMLDVLGAVCADFHQLRDQTPLAATTPRMRRLYAYEAHLLKVLDSMGRFLEWHGYHPTADPHQD